MIYAYFSDLIAVNKGKVNDATKNIFFLARVNPDKILERYMMMD